MGVCSGKLIYQRRYSIEQHAVQMLAQGHALAIPPPPPHPAKKKEIGTIYGCTNLITQDHKIQRYKQLRDSYDLRQNGCGGEPDRQEKEKIIQDFGFFFILRRQAHC